MWSFESPADSRAVPDAGLGALTGAFGLALATLAAGHAVHGANGASWALTIAHASLLGAAVAWGGRERPARPAVALVLAVLLAGATAVAALDARAAPARLVVPAAIACLAVRGHLTDLGLDGRVPLRPLLAGLAIGAGLGVHLLVSAGLTLGYRVRPDLGGWLSAVTYDVGANLPAAELFFRGALFNRLERRRGAVTAAALATTACTVRYLLDPRLPAAPEVLLGAVFYVGLASVAACWLFWWSGSLVPGLAVSTVFFLCWRLLVGG